MKLRPLIRDCRALLESAGSSAAFSDRDIARALRRRLRESKDAEGHEHKGSGPGGGQFTGNGGGSEADKGESSDPHRTRHLERRRLGQLKELIETESTDDASLPDSVSVEDAGGGSSDDLIHPFMDRWDVVEKRLSRFQATEAELAPLLALRSESAGALSPFVSRYEKGVEQLVRLLPAPAAPARAQESMLDEARGELDEAHGSLWAAVRTWDGKLRDAAMDAWDELDKRDPLRESKDAEGHDHKGSGPGGGQFTGDGGGGKSASTSVDKPDGGGKIPSVPTPKLDGGKAMARGKIVPTGDKGIYRLTDAEGTVLGYGSYEHVRKIAGEFGEDFPESEAVHLVSMMTPEQQQKILDQFKDVPIGPIKLSPAAQALKAKRDGAKAGAP